MDGFGQGMNDESKFHKMCGLSLRAAPNIVTRTTYSLSQATEI